MRLKRCVGAITMALSMMGAGNAVSIARIKDRVEPALLTTAIRSARSKTKALHKTGRSKVAVSVAQMKRAAKKRRNVAKRRAARQI